MRDLYATDKLDLAYTLASHLFDPTAPAEIVMAHAKKMIENGEVTDWDVAEDTSDLDEDDTCLWNQDDN